MSRSVALVIVAAVAVISPSRGWASAAAAAMVVVQAIDTLIGAGEHSLAKTAGPALFAIVNLALLVLLLRSTG